MVTIKRLVLLGLMFSSGCTVASNVWILNKVKEGSIYVEVSYSVLLIPYTKRVELRYNEELSLYGSPAIKSIRIRNSKDEAVTSRIASIMGDDVVTRACDEYIAANPQKYGKATIGNARSSGCFTGFLRDTGARLVNGEIVINQFIKNVLLPVAFAVTRKPGTQDFVVSELATGLTGREPFYYYVKGKDLK